MANSDGIRGATDGRIQQINGGRVYKTCLGYDDRASYYEGSLAGGFRIWESRMEADRRATVA